MRTVFNTLSQALAHFDNLAPNLDAYDYVYMAHKDEMRKAQAPFTVIQYNSHDESLRTGGHRGVLVKDWLGCVLRDASDPMRRGRE